MPVDALGGLSDAGPGKVADGLRPVLIAPGRDDAVEFSHELVVDGDGHALHGAASRQVRPACCMHNRRSGQWPAQISMPARTLSSGRAALTDAGVDGGARADRNRSQLFPE
jgi:hypothetical protein